MVAGPPAVAEGGIDVVLDFEQRSLKGIFISTATRAPVRVGFVMVHVNEQLKKLGYR